MNIDEFLNLISDKYHYDEHLIELLRKIIPSMIRYFGEEYETRILSSFLNTPIGFVRNSEDVQKFANNLGVKGIYTMPSVASAGYENYFQLNDDNQIESISFIIVREHDVDEQYLDTLVHEFCHMVMNYGKYQIIDNKVYSQMGVSKDIIEIVDGQLKVKSEGLNFEEGLNEFDARRITKMITGRELEKGAYQLYYDYVSYLMMDEKSRSIVNESRLNGDDEWKIVLGEELSNDYLNALEDYSKTAFDFSISKNERKVLKNQKFEEMIRLIGKVNTVINDNRTNANHDINR